MGNVSLKNGTGIFSVEERTYNILKSCMTDNVNIWNILLVGPSGCGKTTLPGLVAQESGLEVLKMDCGTIRDPEEWFGKRGAANGATFFSPSPLVSAIKRGSVVILDELNRVQPYILSTLYGILDDTRKVIIHDEEILVNKKTTIFATINEGVQYSGTFRLDEALRQRFDMFISVDYPSNEQDVYASITNDADAEMIYQILSLLRAWNMKEKQGLDVSTRTGVKIAKLTRSFKMDIDEAIKFTILNSISNFDTRKSVLDMVNGISGTLSRSRVVGLD